MRSLCTCDLRLSFACALKPHVPYLALGAQRHVRGQQRQGAAFMSSLQDGEAPGCGR